MLDEELKKMTEDYAMDYEYYIRQAFGGADKVERYGDPARLADADRFKEEDLNFAKIGLAYATCLQFVKSSGQTEEQLEKSLDIILKAKAINELVAPLKELRKIQRN